MTFVHAGFVYTTTGRTLGEGGMGTTAVAQRRPEGAPQSAGEAVAVKTFRDEVMLAVREDPVARRHFEHSRAVVAHVQGIAHPNVHPIYVAVPCADNFVFVTPLAGDSLYAALTARAVSPHERMRFLLEALRGLAVLHENGVVHRDFTLHNVLLARAPDGGRRGVVFDFDLSVMPALLPPGSRSYRAHYGGRVVGSPEFSVSPELLDGNLADQDICPRSDVYAVGTALYGLFTERSIYGETPDIEVLVRRIDEGLVVASRSTIVHPKEVPPALRPIIETCVERDPALRPADAGAVLRALVDVAERLPQRPGRARFRATLRFARTDSGEERCRAVHGGRPDESVTLDDITRADQALGSLGYLLERSLGRVKGHAIFLARRDPAVLAAAGFEGNTFPKVVTAIDLAKTDDRERFVQTWVGRIKPVVDRIRRRFLTAIHRVVHHAPTGQLLLFTEHIADPRFGTELGRQEIALVEAFGLGMLLCAPLQALHAEGLAHNNICLESLLFRAAREEGAALPLLVGLVEPSFEPEARLRDVRSLARLLAGLVHDGRIAALARADDRSAVTRLRETLGRIAQDEVPTPAANIFTGVVANGLALVDPNFELLRRHDGDLVAYACLVTRHALYHRLFGASPAPKAYASTSAARFM